MSLIEFKYNTRISKLVIVMRKISEFLNVFHPFQTCTTKTIERTKCEPEQTRHHKIKCQHNAWNQRD